MLWYWIMAAGIVALLAVCHFTGMFPFKSRPRPAAWIVAGLVLLNGGWMAFDGGHALIAGDYVTPKSGPMAGQLGPWSQVVEYIGVGPRSILMETAFLIYGVVFMAVTLMWLRGVTWARWALSVSAVAGLWYLPFGTIINLIVLALLMVLSLDPLGRTS